MSIQCEPGRSSSASDAVWRTGPYDATIQRCPVASRGPQPELVAVLDAKPSTLVADAANLYVVTEKSEGRADLLVVPKNGSALPHVIATLQAQPSSIAVDKQRIYWTDSSSGIVAACSLSGCTGEPTLLATGQHDPRRVAVDDQNAYWINHWDAPGLDEILECPLSGCGASPRILASGQTTSGRGLVLDTTHVYWTNDGGERLEDGSYIEGNVSRVGK